MEEAKLDVEAGLFLLREPVVGSVWRGKIKLLDMEVWVAKILLAY